MTDKSKENLTRIMDTLEQGVSSVFESEKYKQFLDFCGKFHRYSYGNCLLIMSQFPTATRVASYQTWKKLKCQVKKGEKGIGVLVPIPYSYQKEIQEEDESGNMVLKTVDKNGLRFKVGYVFDESQVDGSIPTLVDELTDDSEFFGDLVNRIMSRNGNIQFDEKLIGGNSKGYCNLTTGDMFIRPEMSALQTIKTMVHEKAHSVLHANSDEKKDKNTLEVEAESIAYCVCTAFGFDTSSYSFDYVASWSSGKETKELKKSLSTIEKTTRTLIDWFSSSTDLTPIDGVMNEKGVA